MQENHFSEPVTLASLEEATILAPLFTTPVRPDLVLVSANEVEVLAFMVDEAGVNLGTTAVQPGQQMAVRVVNNGEDSVEVTITFTVENPAPYLGDPTNTVSKESM